MCIAARVDIQYLLSEMVLSDRRSIAAKMGTSAFWIMLGLLRTRGVALCGLATILGGGISYSLRVTDMFARLISAPALPPTRLSVLPNSAVRRCVRSGLSRGATRWGAEKDWVEC
jgi:hypothetical protein